MSIVSINTDVVGQIGVRPRRVKIVTTDSLSQVTTAGWLNPQNLEGFTLDPTDFIDIVYSYSTATNSGTNAVMVPSFSLGVITLSLWVDAGNVLLPVVANHIALFQGTTGQIGSTAATAINDGSIQAGRSSVAGTVSSFPSTAAKGSLIVSATANTGNTTTTITNDAMGQASVISIPDPGAATAKFALSQSSAASNNVTFTKVITATFTQLATAGLVSVQAHTSATSQFCVLDVKVLKSTGLSGGGGNRLLSLTDGTIVFNNAGITAALLGTPILTLWGGTGNPVAIGASEVTTAGADLSLQYSGGTTDYTAGSVQLAITLVQVTL